MKSFVRQLNLYGFHKMKSEDDTSHFQHKNFRRGRPELLIEIKKPNQVNREEVDKLKMEVNYLKSEIRKLSAVVEQMTGSEFSAVEEPPSKKRKILTWERWRDSLERGVSTHSGCSDVNHPEVSLLDPPVSELSDEDLLVEDVSLGYEPITIQIKS